MKKWIFVAFVAAIGTVSNAAEPTDDAFAVEGAGRLNCAAFMAAREKKAHDRFRGGLSQRREPL